MRHRAQRPPAHRPLHPDPGRRRGDLEDAGGRVARPAHDGGRHRRRGPPRPPGHVQRHHRHAAEGGEGARRDRLGGGGEPHLRRPGQDVRDQGAGPADRGLLRRRERDQPRDDRRSAHRGPPRPARRGLAPYGAADGYDHVLCNGAEIVRHGEFTANRPGAMLRSGTDTTGTGIA